MKDSFWGVLGMVLMALVILGLIWIAFCGKVFID